MRRRIATLAVMGALGALGLGVPASGLLVALRRDRDDRMAAVDREFARLRDRLRPGERIGLIIVGEDPEDERLSRARYALAPAIVEPIRDVDCADGASGDCRLRLVEWVALSLPQSAAASSLEQRLGLVPVEMLDGVLLLRRRAP